VSAIAALDLNHIFLFVAVISPLLVVARAWRPGSSFRGWRIAAGVVLAVTAISWFVVRDFAGYIGGAIWFFVLFIPAIGLKRVTELFEQRRYRAAARLATMIHVLHPTADLRRQIRLFHLLGSQQNIGTESEPPPISRPANAPNRLNSAPAVLFFIVANVIVFLIEILCRAADNPGVFHRLGALDVYSVVLNHQYWRLLTALFLHYDVVHLGFNLFALYVLGPTLERTIGTFRFALCYLLSGIGSSAGVIILTVMRIARPGEVIGASGCIMGIVGAWAGFLLRHHHVPGARQRLMNILMIVAIQTAFDLSTPQVSMAAHICGLLTGLVVGLLLAPRVAI
jgi:membrane associated rhomboid family serine protease